MTGYVGIQTIQSSFSKDFIGGYTRNSIKWLQNLNRGMILTIEMKFVFIVNSNIA
ncbi:hypothetical protein HNO89_002796 [Sporosarcina luteola]|nr:hypothetical protein [Sporosarcina luteola]